MPPGTMDVDVTDPREDYDDLVVTEGRQVLDPGQFRAERDSRAAASGWVVTVYAFDDDGRVLMIRCPWADGWLAPAGTVEPGETLAETAVREVREETGIEITPDRPRAVSEVTVENDATGESFGMRYVAVEAVAEATAIADDLGLDGEAIEAARWFDGLPDEVFNPEFVRRVYRECDRSDPA